MPERGRLHSGRRSCAQRIRLTAAVRVADAAVVAFSDIPSVGNRLFGLILAAPIPNCRLISVGRWSRRASQASISSARPTTHRSKHRCTACSVRSPRGWAGSGGRLALTRQSAGGGRSRGRPHCSAARGESSEILLSCIVTTCRGSQPLFAPVLRTWHVTGSDTGIAIRRVGRYRVSGESKMTARGVMTAVPKRAGVFGALDSGSPLRETSAAS